MPRRKEKLRSRRLNDRVVDRMRETIALGCPWIRNQNLFAKFDLIGLVDGYFFGFALDVLNEDDEEGKRELWESLKDEILAQHYQRRPGTRPSAWWRFDKPEPRRLLRIDPKYIACDEGRIYEDDRSYLERLNLLSPTEKEIFKKFGDVEFVRIAQGVFGECKECWQEARDIAKEIEFDLAAVTLPYEIFWLPEDLVFDCEHSELYAGTGHDGIFEHA